MRLLTLCLCIALSPSVLACPAKKISELWKVRLQSCSARRALADLVVSSLCCFPGR